MTYSQHFAEYLENASYAKRCVLQYASGDYSLCPVCRARDGFGVILSLYTSDSVRPPHMHAELINHPEVHCRFLITKNAPQSVSDLRVMDGDEDVFSTEIKENIVKWANGTTSYGPPIWAFVKKQWCRETDSPYNTVFPD